jgi:hypothetical protein
MDQAEKDELRKYLLGQLTEEQEEHVELQLLTDAGYGEEFDITVDEIAEQYVTGTLQGKEREQAQQYFFKSADRRESLKFEQVLSKYGAQQRGQRAAREQSENPTWLERWRAFWNGKTWLLAVAAAAVVVIAIVSPGGLWLSRSDREQAFASISLSSSADSRNGNREVTKVLLPLSAPLLRIQLKIPEGAPPATGYQVELLNDKLSTSPLEIIAQDATSVSVVIPASQLTPGQYAIRISAKQADGNQQRLAGSYFFSVQ